MQNEMTEEHLYANTGATDSPPPRSGMFQMNNIQICVEDKIRRTTIIVTFKLTNNYINNRRWLIHGYTLTS